MTPSSGSFPASLQSSHLHCRPGDLAARTIQIVGSEGRVAGGSRTDFFMAVLRLESFQTLARMLMEKHAESGRLSLCADVPISEVAENLSQLSSRAFVQIQNTLRSSSGGCRGPEGPELALTLPNGPLNIICFAENPSLEAALGGRPVPFRVDANFVRIPLRPPSNFVRIQFCLQIIRLHPASSAASLVRIQLRSHPISSATNFVCIQLRPQFVRTIYFRSHRSRNRCPGAALPH